MDAAEETQRLLALQHQVPALAEAVIVLRRQAVLDHLAGLVAGHPGHAGADQAEAIARGMLLHPLQDQEVAQHAFQIAQGHLGSSRHFSIARLVA